jgi:hypothetical protein
MTTYTEEAAAHLREAQKQREKGYVPGDAHREMTMDSCDACRKPSLGEGDMTVQLPEGSAYVCAHCATLPFAMVWRMLIPVRQAQHRAVPGDERGVQLPH